MLVVTMNDLPGYHLRAILGEVVGVTARPQNKFTEGVRSLDGNLSDSGEQFLVAGRREAPPAPEPALYEVNTATEAIT